MCEGSHSKGCRDIPTAHTTKRVCRQAVSTNKIVVQSVGYTIRVEVCPVVVMTPRQYEALVSHLTDSAASVSSVHPPPTLSAPHNTPS